MTPRHYSCMSMAPYAQIRIYAGQCVSKKKLCGSQMPVRSQTEFEIDTVQWRVLAEGQAMTGEPRDAWPRGILGAEWRAHVPNEVW